MDARQELSPQIKTNAMISYFFLGWLFLLARNNPTFSHPFIRSHAKKATKLQVVIFGGFIIYSLYISQYIPNFLIPIIPSLTLDKIISIGFFALLAISIIRGAYLAHHGKMENETSSHRLKEAFAQEHIALE